MRPNRGNVCRQNRRAGRGRDAAETPAAPLHRGADLIHSAGRPGYQAGPDHAIGRNSQPGQPAIRLRVPYALPLRQRYLLGRAAAAGAGRVRTFRELSLCQRAAIARDRGDRVSQSSRYLAFISYLLSLPGALFVLLARRDDPFAVYHAGRSLRLAIIAVAAPLAWAAVAW